FGMEGRIYWPGMGEVTPDELVLRKLLPMAHEGLERWGVAAEVRDRYLGIIEARAKTGRNGAVWQIETVRAMETKGLSRPKALQQMLRIYCEGMHSNEPVHTWELPT
ncbi:MAG: glutamate--cysteine ligase, partial [Geodermatophilaceae bacterium]|nr:glutamate--cysteine ligase [Geodermatophilaceae bacterium]